jgi:DNA-binding NarL/FixJ family response regulator
MKRPRVLLAEDHAQVAEQLRRVLEADFEVVATTGDGQTLLRLAAALRPDLIVTDIALPVLDGLATARALRERQPDARIVLVTAHNDPALVQEGLAAGALGYVLKAIAGKEVVPAVRAALRGERQVALGERDPPGDRSSRDLSQGEDP